MSESFPKPDTLYRIQSVDFDTCLELWDVEEEPVVLRQSKESELQKWLFFRDNASDRYKIMAAATQASSYPVYLTIPVSDSNLGHRPLALPTEEAGASLWRVTKGSDGSYALSTKGTDARPEKCLSVSESGMLETTEKTISIRRPFSRNLRWQIVEYWPSVPKDTYRIRTLTGDALDIDERFTRFSVGAVRNDHRQEWNVKPVGNGKCVIALNTSETVFLGWVKSHDGIRAQVVTSQTPVDWFIKSLGEYTYSITIEYDMDETTIITLALSTRNEEVLLKPRKTVPSQIWFFESVEVPSLPSPSPDEPPAYSLDLSSTRYEEIPEGGYYIRNVGNRRYFVSAYASARWRLVSSNTKHMWTMVCYVDNGPGILLFYGVAHYLSCADDCVEVVETKEEATIWVLEREADPSGGYLYYICPSFDTSLAISGMTVAGAGGNHFRLTTKNIGSHWQQWKFEV